MHGRLVIVATIGFTKKSAEERSAANLRLTAYRKAGPLRVPLAWASFPVQRPGIRSPGSPAGSRQYSAVLLYSCPT